MILLHRYLDKARSFARIHKNTLLLFVCSFVFACAVFYPQIKAGLWIADDHQILDFVSQAGRSFSGFWTVITHPSDYPLASQARLRPVYWPIRISEIFLWYDSGFGWHFARLLMITTFLSLIARGIYNLTNVYFAILVIFLIVQLDSVAGVWTRLGNAEAYAAVGVAAIIWASASLMRSAMEQHKASVLTLTILNLGILLAIGSKENFFLFALFLLIAPCYAVWQRQRAFPVMLTWTAASAIMFIMAKHLLKSLTSTNRGDHSLFIGLFNQLTEGIATLMPFLWFPLLLFVLAVFLSAFSSNTRFTRPLKPDNILFVSVCCFLLVCCVSQPTFHLGDWPANNVYSRYNFVGWFCAFLIGSLSSSVIYRAIVIAKAGYTPQSHSSIFNAASLGVLCAAFLIYQHPPIYHQALATFNRTERTDRGLSSISKLSEEKNLDFLTIEVQSSRDYEASISTIIHLRHRGLQLPVYVRVKPKSDPYHQNALLDRLRQFSAQGERNFSPIGDLDEASSKCLSVFFYKVEIDDTLCEKFTFSY